MSDDDISFIRPQWLIPQKPGMQCQPHTLILVKFAVYNIVSVAISYLIAMPFFVVPYKRAVNAASRKCLYIARSLSCRRAHPETTTRRPIPFDPSRQTTLSLVMSIGGSIALSVAAPVIVAFVLAGPNRNEVDPWSMIQQWATRPRATWMIYFVHSILGRVHSLRIAGTPDPDEELDEPPHGFYVTAVTAILNEAVINLLGINYVYSQAHAPADYAERGSRPRLGPYEYYPDDIPPMMQQGAQGLAGVVIFWESLFGLYVLIFLVFKIFGLCSCMKRFRHRHNPENNIAASHTGVCDVWGLVGAFIPLAMLCLPVYALSWHLWRGFLGAVPVSLYCVENSAAIDAVYCLLPVFLGLWRMAWTIRG